MSWLNIEGETSTAPMAGHREVCAVFTIAHQNNNSINRIVILIILPSWLVSATGRHSWRDGAPTSINIHFGNQSHTRNSHLALRSKAPWLGSLISTGEVATPPCVHRAHPSLGYPQPLARS